MAARICMSQSQRRKGAREGYHVVWMWGLVSFMKVSL
jgi:hypothetical protein